MQNDVFLLSSSFEEEDGYTHFNCYESDCSSTIILIFSTRLTTNEQSDKFAEILRKHRLNLQEFSWQWGKHLKGQNSSAIDELLLALKGFIILNPPIQI
jgi:hypothetical protein